LTRRRAANPILPIFIAQDEIDDSQLGYGLGLAGKAPALDRRARHPGIAGPRLVDDAHDAAPRAAGEQDRAWRAWYEESHVILSYLLAALVVVHIGGALRHHFFKHNDVLRRMWFSARQT
jgi:hypothetical protein